MRGQFKAFSALAPVGVFLTDRHGEWVEVNGRWSALAQLSPDDARGQGWLRVVHPRDFGRVVTEWRQATEAQMEFVSEHRYLTPAGDVL
jgi:PAS domain S-box-containing protein